MSGERVRERVIDWLAGKAADYLQWVYERGLARARATEPECPDCEQPESYCCCAEKYEQDRRDRDVFDSGAHRGYEEAMREVGERI